MITMRFVKTVTGGFWITNMSRDFKDSTDSADQISSGSLFQSFRDLTVNVPGNLSVTYRLVCNREV